LESNNNNDDNYQQDEVKEERDIDSITDIKEQADKYLANWQRTEADFVNYKKRSEQERREISKNTTAMLIFSLLPVLDDFDRALASTPKKPELRAWTEGIQLIERKLFSILETQGLTKMNVLGHQFDPNFHDAVSYLEGDEEKVIQVLQSGYMLGDRVLRPAMVIVGKGKEEEEKLIES